jgi:hypothetical protein
MNRNRTLEYLMKKYPEIVKIDNYVNKDEQLFKTKTFKEWCDFLIKYEHELPKNILDNTLGKILQYTKFIKTFYNMILLLKGKFIKKYVSKNKYITSAFVQSNLNLNWDWNKLACHKNMDIKFIEAHHTKLLNNHAQQLSENPNLTIEFISKNAGTYEYFYNTLKYIDTSKNNIDVIIQYYKKYITEDEDEYDIFYFLLKNKTLSSQDIEKLFKKIDVIDMDTKITISMNKNITIDLIEKYPHNFHLKALGGNSFKYQNKIFDAKIKKRIQLYYYLSKKICYDLSRHITANYLKIMH